MTFPLSRSLRLAAKVAGFAGIGYYHFGKSNTRSGGLGNAQSANIVKNLATIDS